MPDFIKLVREPGNPLFNPPPNWETLVIPSGTQPVFYDYQHFGIVWGFDDPPQPVTKLIWERVYFWLGPQEFCIQELQKNNVWKDTGHMINGPTQKHYLSMIDGENKLLRLMAE